jgi:hypothetical protein
MRTIRANPRDTEKTMAASLQALLTGLIDYAGLFPPAKLPLDQAIQNYAEYRRGPDRWMLGRFIIPAGRLCELAAFDGCFHKQPPFVFAVLGSGGDKDSFIDGLRVDLAAIKEFRNRHAGRVQVDVVELKAPNDPATLARAAEEIAGFGQATLSTYFESDWQMTPPQAGFKLRCGGLEATAFPTVEQVAAAIIGCRERGLHFKATAGLHHPMRRYDPALQTHMHGFMNVFAGAVLAAVHGLDERLLCKILADEQAGHFAFNNAGFSWAKLWVSTEQIRAARKQFVAFGSCSFDEPRQDLRALGWLR